MKTKEEIKAIIRAKATITVKAEQEDSSYSSAAYNYGADMIAAIGGMVRKHGLWGWCVAVVTVTYNGQTATDYLGGCSNDGKKDFVANSGYYGDMVDTCLNELADTIIDLLEDFA